MATWLHFCEFSLQEQFLCKGTILKHARVFWSAQVLPIRQMMWTGDMAQQVNDLPHSGKAQVQLSRADIKAKFKDFTNLHLVKRHKQKKKDSEKCICRIVGYAQETVTL